MCHPVLHKLILELNLLGVNGLVRACHKVFEGMANGCAETLSFI
jgi:hypothetical protein